MRIILVGLGNVGQGLLTLLHQKADTLAAQYSFNAQIVGVITGRHGTLYHPHGLNITDLLHSVSTSSIEQYPYHEGLRRDLRPLALIQGAGADVLVESSPSNFQTAMPALDYCYAALESGKHVVMANKGPVALAYDELIRRAALVHKQVLFEATVMSGTPSIRIAQEGLRGAVVQSMRGILNGTTNYILTQMESGLPYADALQQAQELGYAETDPSGDVDGWDAAGKVLILAAALFHRRLKLTEIEVEGITRLTPQDIDDARAAGERWKLIASLTPQSASVKPQRIPLSDPLASVSGATNAITYTSDVLGEVTLIGRGAGRTETGFGLLADLLSLHRTTR